MFVIAEILVGVLFWGAVAVGVGFYLVHRWDQADAIQEAERQYQSVGPIIARFGPIILYDSPPRVAGPTGENWYGDPRGEFALEGEERAFVETAGNISVTRGRNLAAKAVGGAMTGGLGFFAFGNAKERTTDSRELYLIVEGSGWAYTRQLDPEGGALAREFAAAVNAASTRVRRAPVKQVTRAVASRASKRREVKPASSRHAATPSHTRPSGADAAPVARSRDQGDDLERLERLRDEGVLSASQFEAQRRRLL